MADFRLSRRRSDKSGEAKPERRTRQSVKESTPAAPISPEQSSSLLSQAGGHALSGLHTISSILSLPSRLLWGSVNSATGGDGGMGNINPLDSTGGIELSHVLGNHGVIPKNDPTKWEWGDVGRGLVDIAGDPTSYLPPFALTKAGQAAAKGGRLASGITNQIRHGQRGLVGLRVPLAASVSGAVGSGPAVAAGLEGIGRYTGLTRLSRAVSQSSPIIKAKELFHASSMGRTTAATQHTAEGIYGDITRGQNDIELGVVNSARNMQHRAVHDGETERHLAELGVPSPQIAPLLKAKDTLHQQTQSLGVPTGDLANTVKMFTKVGDKRARVTKVLDASGNVVHTITNPLGKKSANIAEANFLVPNTPVAHVPRFVGEGVEWGGHGMEQSSRSLSSQNAINQHRNVELFGGAHTSTIENAVQSAAGIQPRLASAALGPDLLSHKAAIKAAKQSGRAYTLPASGLSANQQARILSKIIKRQATPVDRALGTDLTKSFKASKESVREISRPRELGQFVQANPQLAETGLFTNHPLADIHHQMSGLNESAAKASGTLDFMAQHGHITHNEPSDVLRAHGMDNPPTVRQAGSQLGLAEPQVAQNVMARLPKPVLHQVETAALKEANRQATHSAGIGATQHEIDKRASVLYPGLVHDGVLNLHLPAKEYKSLVGFADRAPAQSPGFLKDLNTVWKANMLAHPATHSRNALSAIVTNVLQGAGGPIALKHGVDLVRGKQIRGYSAIPAVGRLMGQQNINETEALRRLAATYFPSNHSLVGDLPPGQVGATIDDVVSNVPGTSFTPLHQAVTSPLAAAVGFRRGEHVGVNAANPAAIAGAFGHKETSFGPAMASNMAARNIEQPIRIGSWLGLMKQGYDPEVAAKMVGQAQVNYGAREFSESEKKLKSVIPFYSFATRQGKHVLKQLTTDPGGRMAQVVKSQDRAHASDPSVPDSILSGTAIPLSQSDDGTKRFLTGLGLAHEPAVHTLGALARGNLQGAMFDVLGMLNPLYKTPLEFTTGQSFFQRGEPSGNLDPTLGRTLSNLKVMAGYQPQESGPSSLTGTKVGDVALETLVQASPLSRVASSLRTATDTRKTAAEKATNLLTGVRVTDLSPKRQITTLMRRAEELAKSEGAKSRSDVYFNKKELERLKEEDPALYKRQKELQQLLKRLKAKPKTPKDAKDKKAKKERRTLRKRRAGE